MKQLFLRFRNSNNARALLSNFASLGILQCANYILPLIALPYTAITLGPHYFGLIGFSTAVIIYFQTFVDYGFNYTATRDIATNRTDIKIITKVFSNVLACKFILCSAAFAVLLAIIAIIPGLSENSILLIVTFSFIPAAALFPEWLFQGLEKMHNIAISSLVAKIVCTALIFVLVKSPEDYLYIPILTATSYSISAIIAWFIIIKNKLVGSFIWPSFREIIVTLKEGFDVFLNIFAPNLYSNFGTIVLGHSHSLAAVGILEAAKRLILVSTQLTNLCSRVFFPYLSRNKGGHKYFILLCLPLFVLASLLFLFLADWVIDLLYSSEYIQAALPLKIMALTPILYFITTAYGVNFLIPRGKTVLLRNITLVTSIAGCLGALIAVPLFGIVGAAVSLMVARLLSAILFYIFSRRILREESAPTP